MSDLSATNCQSGCRCGGDMCGNNNCIFLILILLFCCGNGCGSTFGGNNSCIWIIILLLFCNNGCDCDNNFNLGCGC